ncbi:MAG: hypothetical protein LBI05_06590, partial [Planctomycetaceae bacterium]|nr:hypothetical protein [Planctomycetaceae bacterium]
ITFAYQIRTLRMRQKRIWRVEFPMLTTMQDRPITSVLDSLGRIIPLERHFSLVPCFPACIGFFRAK